MSFAADYIGEPRPGELTLRGVYVPPWYTPHADLGVEVKDSSGHRMGFQLGEVVVERRWAIHEDGRCLDQKRFEEKLHEWRLGQFRWQIPPKLPTDLSFSSIPSVEAYVARGPDPADPRRLVDITHPRPRTTLLQKREPIVDEALTKSPHWRPAPKEEKPEPEAAAPVPEPEPVPKKPAREVTLLTCDLCGQEGLKGKNGLRFHKNHKHKDAA